MADQNFLGGFAQGFIEYQDYFPNDLHPRLVLPIRVGDKLTTRAIVDTASPWCILNPVEANQIGLPTNLPPDFAEQLSIRGATYTGYIHRAIVTLRAEAGVDLDVEASIFVPKLYPNEEWRLPNFLGLQGFLERIRFAVDPAANRFYFGAINGG